MLFVVENIYKITHKNSENIPLEVVIHDSFLHITEKYSLKSLACPQQSVAIRASYFLTGDVPEALVK